MAVRGFRSIDKNAFKNMADYLWNCLLSSYWENANNNHVLIRDSGGMFEGEFSEAKPCSTNQASPEAERFFPCATVPGQHGCCLSLSWQQLLVIRIGGITCRGSGCPGGRVGDVLGGQPTCCARIKGPRGQGAHPA